VILLREEKEGEKRKDLDIRQQQQQQPRFRNLSDNDWNVESVENAEDVGLDQKELIDASHLEEIADENGEEVLLKTAEGVVSSVIGSVVEEGVVSSGKDTAGRKKGRHRTSHGGPEQTRIKIASAGYSSDAFTDVVDAVFEDADLELDHRLVRKTSRESGTKDLLFFQRRFSTTSILGESVDVEDFVDDDRIQGIPRSSICLQLLSGESTSFFLTEILAECLRFFIVEPLHCRIRFCHLLKRFDHLTFDDEKERNFRS